MQNTNEQETDSREETVIVSISEIKKLMSEGVTRRSQDLNYNPNLGSIEEKYHLTKAEVTSLFQDPRLKGLKVTVPKPSRVVIAEDINIVPTDAVVLASTVSNVENSSNLDPELDVFGDVVVETNMDSSGGSVEGSSPESEVLEAPADSNVNF